jgi:hypothetical protein
MKKTKSNIKKTISEAHTGASPSTRDHASADSCASRSHSPSARRHRMRPSVTAERRREGDGVMGDGVRQGWREFCLKKQMATKNESERKHQNKTGKRTQKGKAEATKNSFIARNLEITDVKVHTKDQQNFSI